MSFHEPFMLHIRWKIIFIGHIKRRKQLSERLMDMILHESDCKLEHWLLSNATIGVRDTPEFVEACRRHSRFHDEMRRLASLINLGMYDQAERSLDLGSSYERASLRLATSLSALGQIAQLV